MKHILQWKFIFIMFFCMFCGLTAMSVAEIIVLKVIAGMTSEQADAVVISKSIYFNILFCFVMIGVFFLLSRRIIKRIEDMNQNVARIMEGKIELLSEDKSKDELGSLSMNINEMARKIQNSLDKEREMVCSVAHDLRTPVTSIQGYAKLLEGSKDLSTEEKQYLSVIEQKSVALSGQIEELLEYSVLQFEEKEYELIPISLGKLLEQVVVEFIPQFEQEHMTFQITGNTVDYQVNCNQNLMIRLFENLLNNSIRYGKKGKVIEISLWQKANRLHIDISNYSSELTEDEMKHLFEAFYQGQDAKEYRTESKGLGLAIVQKIAAIHQGSICVSSSVSTTQGMNRITFSLDLPIFIKL